MVDNASEIQTNGKHPNKLTQLTDKLKKEERPDTNRKESPVPPHHLSRRVRNFITIPAWKAKLMLKIMNEEKLKWEWSQRQLFRRIKKLWIIEE